MFDWLSDIGDWLGSAFDSAAPSITEQTQAGYGGNSLWSNAIPQITNNAASSGGSIWSSPDLWGAIIGAGTGLAGNYFGQQGAADSNAAQLEMAANEIAARKEMQDKEIAARLQAANSSAGAQVAAAKIAAGAQLGVARKNNLQQLYSQWATNTRQAGADEAEAALKGGQMMQSPILARLQNLR